MTGCYYLYGPRVTAASRKGENSATPRRIMGAAMSTILACPHCGFANPPGAKFCANCGRPVASRCPECGADLAPGARFCSNCGIPLAGGARSEPGVSAEVPVEARKVVTVLFADLAGSTALTQRLDPEEARQVV